MISEIKVNRGEGNLLTVSHESAKANSSLQAVFEKWRAKSWGLGRKLHTQFIVITAGTKWQVFDGWEGQGLSNAKRHVPRGRAMWLPGTGYKGCVFTCAAAFFIWGSICQNPITYMSWWSPTTISLKIYNYACHRVSPEQVFIHSAMFILYFCLTLPFYFSFYKHIWTEIVHGSLTASLFCFFCFFVFFAISN